MRPPTLRSVAIAAILVTSAACLSRSRPDESAAATPVPPAKDTRNASAAWRERLAADGLGRYVEALEPFVRPEIRIRTRTAVASRLGQSRLGGQPDLPADLPWPRYEEIPLSFLAQVDLAELPDGPAREMLPRDGHLWFFYARSQPWGFRVEHAGGARVFHRPTGAVLAATAPPPDLPEDGAFEVVPMSFENGLSLPDVEHVPARAEEAGPVKIAREDWDRYDEVRLALAFPDKQPAHKLLGHADSIQGPMERQAALLSSSIDLKAGRSKDARVREIRQQAGRWRLLLQLDSDDRTDMMWGDAGKLYVWIRDDDLAARRFERTWTILQCY